MRSLSLVRRSGYVEASSQSVNVGQSRAPLLFLPTSGQGRMPLCLASGRDFADASLALDPAPTLNTPDSLAAIALRFIWTTSSM